MKRLSIFVSGSGTNMENILKHVREGKIPAEVPLIVCDKPGAGAIEKAKKFGVEVALIDRKAYSSKEDFEKEIIRRVEAAKIDFIVLAGFMRILSESFVKHFEGRIINIHPSYLPQFPGAHAIRDAFEAKVRETGVTVHFVIPEVDAGPIILQRKLVIEPRDTLETLEAKIHALEYELYPEALRVVLSGKVRYRR